MMPQPETTIARRRVSEAGWSGAPCRKSRGGWRAALVLVVFGLSAACSWTVVPPHLDQPGTAVMVTSYDKHARLALPSGDGRFIEYGFGDWHYYALEQWGTWSMLRGAFLSQGSAFSRRHLAWTDDPEAFRRVAGGVSTHRVEVDPARVAALRQRLEARWEELDGERVHRDWEDLTLARWDRRYHLFDNSNHKVVYWLRELDVEVRGWTLTNRFRLVDTPAPGG